MYKITYRNHSAKRRHKLHYWSSLHLQRTGHSAIAFRVINRAID
jgi:hypothetical protein